MVLKRKRSSPGFSSPASDTQSTCSTDSNTGSLPFFYAQSKPVERLYHKPTWTFPTYDDGAPHYRSTADMNSRTRKRHRDDRPEEDAVYSNTISRLFNAQRLHPQAEPLPPQPTLPAHRPEHPQRSTLHAFWSIATPAPTQMADIFMVVDPPANSSNHFAPRCEDCDDPLRRDDAMDLGEDGLMQDTACVSCKRCVCDRCAVLGNARICLGCASGHER